MSCCGVILAGGKSSRMGTNKALLTLNNQTVIEHVVLEMQAVSDCIVIVTNEPEQYQFLNIPMIADRYKQKGPLAGIEAAMYYKQASDFIVAACDMPFIHRNIYRTLYHQLDGYDAVVPIVNDRLQPLSGIYRKEAWPVIRDQLDKNKLKLESFINQLNVNYVDAFDKVDDEQVAKHFFNMNDPLQYQQAQDF